MAEVEANEYLRNGKYFPQGYYERFITGNNLKDTEKAKDFFMLICDLFAYHGEEAVECGGNYMADFELDYGEYSRVEKNGDYKLILGNQ